MKTLFTLLVLLPCVVFAQKPIKLKPVRTRSIAVKEPSDVCVSADTKHLYVVSDDGFLVQTDLQGVVEKSVPGNLIDAEAVATDGKFIYVVDEFTRFVNAYKIEDLSFVKSYSFPYGGGRNKAYEALAFDRERNQFYLFTEYEPSWVFILDSELRIKSQQEFKVKYDVSGATMYQGKLWILSDESREIWKVNPDNFEIEKRFSVPIINPEGITFLPNGELLIMSDDLQKMFFFQNPETDSHAK
jgi:uncharacterized protein YjiK